MNTGFENKYTNIISYSIHIYSNQCKSRCLCFYPSANFKPLKLVHTNPLDALPKQDRKTLGFHPSKIANSSVCIPINAGED
ncbi:MAG: hypothetical protein ACI807_003955 [Paracoccaceae bacterium]|jgi:hypothetical protein